MDFEEFASLTPGYVGQDLLKVLRLALFKSQVIFEKTDLNYEENLIFIPNNLPVSHSYNHNYESRVTIYHTHMQPL